MPNSRKERKEEKRRRGNVEINYTYTRFLLRSSTQRNLTTEQKKLIISFFICHLLIHAQIRQLIIYLSQLINFFKSFFQFDYIELNVGKNNQPLCDEDDIIIQNFRYGWRTTNRHFFEIYGLVMLLYAIKIKIFYLRWI